MTGKRKMSLFLALCMLSMFAAGCGSAAASGSAAPAPAPAGSGTPAASDASDAAPAEPPAPATRTIVDQGGNTVVLPEKIERVVISSLWPLPSVYVLFQGSADKLVGMHPASLSAAKYSLLPRVAPEIAEVESGFVIGGEINIEELMKLQPDVVLYSATNTAEKELLEKAGIPAVGFSTSIRDFDCVETINSWVELLGELFQQPDKAAGITEYGRDVYTQIQERLKDVPDEQKPRVLMLYKYSETQMQTSGNRFFGQWWCDATGAVSVSNELAGTGIDINMEQIYEWNPDKIFVTNFSPYLPEDFYANDAVPNQDWSSVKAVADREVYKFPLGMYRWYPPSSDSPLALWWLAKQNHPDLFADIELEPMIKDYYERFYNVSLTDEEVANIFTPAREAADGV